MKRPFRGRFVVSNSITIIGYKGALMRVTRAALTLCLAVAACAPISVPSPTASGTPVVPSASSPAPVLTPVPNGSSPSPTASGARASALPEATDIATRWVAALRARDHRAAWDLLSSASQEAYGSYEKFAADRNAFMDSAKGIVVGPSIDQDPRSMDDWLPAAPGADADIAFVVIVEFPELADVNNGQQILVVAPDQTKTWRIWVVR